LSIPWEANNRPSHTTSRAVSNCGVGVSGTPSSGIQYWPVRGKGRREEGGEGRRGGERRRGGENLKCLSTLNVLSVASIHI